MTPKPPAPAAQPATIWLALITVYLVWGSTYLAIRVIVDSGAPPLLSMGARFVVAGLLLGLVLVLRSGIGVLMVGWRAIGSAGLVGVLLLLGGNGAVAVAEQTVPSGLAALMVAATPLWLVCLRLAAGDRPRRLSLAGTALGFLGIAVLARPGGQDGDVETWGLLLLVFATVSWAVGSFYSSRLPMPGNAFVATMWEMTLGGSLMLLVGALRGELDGFAVGEITGQAWLALGYLVVFGSLLAFTAYVWLLGRAPISLTATYAYVNPVVAVILGALILSEPVTIPILVGGAVVVLGVGLVVSIERPRRAAPPLLEPAGAAAGPAGGPAPGPVLEPDHKAPATGSGQG